MLVLICTGSQAAQCGCGKCNYLAIIDHQCKVQRNGVPFPFINTTRMSDTETDILISRLSEESDEILKKFGTLFNEIKTWLNHAVSLESYKDILRNIRAFEPLSEANHTLLNNRKQEIKEAQDHQTLHDIVNDYVNWFNYQLLGEIVVNKLANANPFDTGLISIYKTELYSFCERCIYECPMQSRTNNSGKYLCLKVEMPTEIMKLKANKIKVFQGQLCRALRLATYSLKLCLVVDGCVQVVFSIPTSVHAALFPLSSDTLNKLVPLGVTKLCTDGYVVERDKDSHNFNVILDKVGLLNIIIIIILTSLHNYIRSIFCPYLI